MTASHHVRWFVPRYQTPLRMKRALRKAQGLTEGSLMCGVHQIHNSYQTNGCRSDACIPGSSENLKRPRPKQEDRASFDAGRSGRSEDQSEHGADRKVEIKNESTEVDPCHHFTSRKRHRTNTTGRLTGREPQPKGSEYPSIMVITAHDK
jgi:hypothetical protein